MLELDDMNMPTLRKYASEFCKDKNWEDIFTEAMHLYTTENNSKQMYFSIFLLGEISSYKMEALDFLRCKVSQNPDWRAQEVLAKAFDIFCSKTGYENALPVINEWLTDKNENVRRAVTEGLRVWTSKPFFKENPEEAINVLSNLKSDPSEYVRTSVGNAISDISKKYQELVKNELNNWNCKEPFVLYTYQIASRHMI
ncbi:HEAT repeat domain-containing protein [Bacillus sp. 123MFChir2]|uniref:HEAT repeat domain-containing protein n=1 Tax=Bacillus sp. 123MFChir2 TaxID=1169144 RepID=UPI00037BC82A|nr:HEAT repeat domain-containing protein [Bacillus sp. 123MFChir2]